MQIEILSIQPSHLDVGTNKCSIQYRVKCSESPVAQISLQLSGSSTVAFSDNGNITNHPSVDYELVHPSYTTYTKEIPITIKEKSRAIQFAQIEIKAIGIMGDEDCFHSDISHE